MRLQVQCYAGRKADQWYGPDDTFFKVRADDGNLYILRHNQPADEWCLESFRQTAN